ncbi:hypothetical protein [Streptomyces sp. CA-106110]|uniref:hypothetical protein n=1 Tax=Streptomyces sp. CA-106110 TaxID=3240044 RepID=UPI003D8E3ECF
MAMLRPDADFLHLLGADRAKERSYSQSCRNWPGTKPHLAILVAQPVQQGQEQIWGLGIVRPAHETDRDRKVFVTHPRRFRESVPLSQLWHNGRELDDALGRSLPASGPVSGHAGIVLANLQRSSPHVAAEVDALAALLDETEGWSGKELRWRDERDALLLFAKIAGVAAKDLVTVHDWNRTAATASFISGLAGDAVQPTLGSFRGEAAAKLDSSGEIAVREFTNTRGRQTYDLEVTSVTASRVTDGEESSLDSYYYHASTGTLVVLRYLRLGPDALLLPGTWHGLEEPSGRSGARAGATGRGTDDYGLLEDPVFLRVHEPVPFTATMHRTSSGAIYPFSQVVGAFAAAVESGLAGLPAGSLARHLVPTDFARLVRDGWLGARNVASDITLARVKQSLATVGAALLVVDYSDRPRGNGPGLGKHSYW